MKKELSILLLFIFTGIAGVSVAQPLAVLEVDLSASAGTDIPVSVSLENFSVLPDSVLSLVEIQGNKTTPVPFQIRQGEQRTLHWIAKSGAQKRNYHILK